jgi:hypothetical protein
MAGTGSTLALIERGFEVKALERRASPAENEAGSTYTNRITFRLVLAHDCKINLSIV